MRYCFFILLLLFLFKTNSFAQKTYIDSLQQIISLGKSDRPQAFTMIKLANEFIRSDVEKAKNVLHQTILLGNNLNDPRILSACYSSLITIHQNTGKMDSAIYYLALLQRLSEDAKGPDRDIIKENYYSTTGLFYKRSGNPKLALPNFIQAVILSEKDGEKTAIAGQLLNLGNTYRDLGDYKNALVSHLKALKYFEEVGNKRGVSFCYQSISNSFAELNQYKDALKYSKKAIDLKTELKDKRGLGTAHDGLGNIYFGLAEYDKALKHFTISLSISKELNLLIDQAKSYFNMGKVYAEKKDIPAAIINFNHSKRLSHQLGDSSALSAADLQLMTLQKNVAVIDAEKKIISSVEMFTKTGDRIKKTSGYKNLALFYEANKQYDKALEYTNKYYRLNDSIQNNDLQMQLKRMEEQYTVEKKETEITILKKDQQLSEAKIQRQKTFQYGAALFFGLLLLTGFLIINRNRVVQRAKRQIEIEKTRNLIARDLHDDIGSTITSINILSKMLLREQNDPKSIQTNLEKIKNNSDLIMESMGDIVWTINPNNDTVEKLIYRMREFASEVLEPLGIIFRFEQKGDISKIALDPVRRKDFFLIFKEAINNAVKYSHCSKIEIIILYEDNNLQMKISDDGDGFDESLVKKGNGIFNIHERAKDMNALLKYHGVPGNGTFLILDVPVT